jgi:hypothetical protein
MVASDNGNIRPEFRLNLFGNQIAPLFGAEDNVEVILSNEWDNCAAPPGLVPYSIGYPGLPRLG